MNERTDDRRVEAGESTQTECIEITKRIFEALERSASLFESDMGLRRAAEN